MKSDTDAEITSTISAVTDQQLLEQTQELARHEHDLQIAILDHLREIEARSLHLRRGFGSLFDYAMRELGYSEAAAWRRIKTMRLCARTPGARARLEDGTLTLSAAAQLQHAFERQERSRTQRRRSPGGAASAGSATPQAGSPPAAAAGPVEPPAAVPVLDVSARQALVDQAAGKSTRQVMQLLAGVDPELAMPAERLRPLGGGRFELKVVIDAECQRGLEQLKGLLSHADPSMTYGALVGRLVKEALDRHDPGRPTGPRGNGRRPARAERTSPAKSVARTGRGVTSPAKPSARPASNGTSPAKAPEQPARPATSAAKSRAIPAASKREVWQRDQRCCSYVDPQTKRRCRSRHLLQIDHVVPYALGGGADPDNLRLLCAAHHRHRHAGFASPREPADLTAQRAPARPDHPYGTRKSVFKRTRADTARVATSMVGASEARQRNRCALCSPHMVEHHRAGGMQRG